MNTTKNLGLTLILITLFITSQAQSNSYFGIKGGWLNSGFLGNDADNQDKKPGFNAGIFFNVTSENQAIGFQPEILFTRKQTSFQAANVREDYELSYLKIPALIKLAIPVSSIRPNIFVGPYVSYKINESYTYTELLTGASSESSDYTKSVDYGMVFGGGVDIDLSSFTLMGDIRYDLGMQKIENAEEPKDVKNGDFSVNIGIAFRL